MHLPFQDETSKVTHTFAVRFTPPFTQQKVFSYNNAQGNNAWYTRVAHPVKEVLKMNTMYMARHGDDLDARFGQREMAHLRKWWIRQRNAHKKFKQRAMETGSSGGQEEPKPTLMMQLREECFDSNHAVAKKAIMRERLRETNTPTNLRLSEESTGRSTSTGTRFGEKAHVQYASVSGSGSRRGGGGSSRTPLTGGRSGGAGSGSSRTPFTAGQSDGSSGSSMAGGTSRGGKGKGRLVHKGNNPRVSSSDGLEEGRDYDVPAGGGAIDPFGDGNESECDWLPTDEENEQDQLRSSRGGG